MDAAHSDAHAVSVVVPHAASDTIATQRVSVGFAKDMVTVLVVAGTYFRTRSGPSKFAKLGWHEVGEVR